MIRIGVQALLMAAKDTKIFLSNRFAVAFAFIFPFLFIIGFTLALRGVGTDDEQLVFTVVTQDQGGFARSIVDSMVADTDGRFVELSYAQATDSLENEEIQGFIAFPADFSSSVVSGQQTSIEVVTLSEHPDTAVALEGVAASIAGLVSLNQVMGQALLSLSGEVGGSPVGLDASLVARVSDEVVFEFEQVGDVRPFNASHFTLPGYLVMFVFFAAAMGAQEIARERESNTLERLASQGVRRQAIIAGKVLASIYRGLMQLAVLWIVGILAFRLDLGASPATVVAVSLLMVVASSAFAVMLASLVTTRRGVDSAAVLVSLILAPIGGSWWLLFIMPEWMQTLARLTPHGWANQAFNKLMLFGATAGDVISEMVALVAFALIFLAVALWRFRTSAP